MRVVGGDLALGGLLGLLGVAVVVEAARLEIGSVLDPQPGFFPFVGALLLIGLSALQVGQALRRRRAPGEGRGDRLGAPAALVAGLVVYVALLRWAGYPLMTTLLVLLALRVQGARWAPAAAASLLLALGSYVLFVRLGVPLPAGALFTD